MDSINTFNTTYADEWCVQPTRRYWGGVGVGVVLCVMALVVAQPFLLVGAAGVFAWLVASQVAFAHAITRFDDSLKVEQAFSRHVVAVDEPTTVTVVVDGNTVGLDVIVRPRPSAGLIVDGALSGPTDTPLVGSVRSPVAGTHSIYQPEFSVRDSGGLFVERFRRGPEDELAVEPREPSRVHVGEGGDTVPIAFGEHAVDAGGWGLVPAELREYVAGEAVSRIDWKATARLATPHVREFEAKSDLTTTFVFDHRGRLDIGPEGETALDYLRAGAIGYLGVARSLGDPVGCYGASDHGVRYLGTPTNNPRGYERLKRQLTGLEATDGAERERSDPSLSQRAPSLETDTEFGRTLSAFVETARTATPSPDPLAAAVRAATTTQQGAVEVVVFTDDRDRAALRTAVAEARHRDNRVILFVAPSVCFEHGTLADLQQASERYREFETFRQELASIEGVTAYEIGPRDRIETLLDAQSRRGT